MFKLFCDSRYTLEEFKLIATEDFKKAFGFHEDIIDELEQLIIEIEKTKAYTHGYYLKKFQLMKPKLNYNYIFIDEFQDFTDCMIEIIKLQEQNGSKIIMAGDMYQKIYRWKGASGDFSSIHFQEELMPKTYRCPQEVVDVANHYVTFLSNGKEKLETHNKNVGKVSYCDIDFEKNIFDINTDWVTTRQDFCAIARTNASLINVANELCTIYNIKNNLSLDMEDIENHYLFFHKKKGSNTFLNSFKGTVTMLKNYYTSVMQFDKASLVNSVQKIRNFRDFKNAVENHSEDKPTLTISTVFSAKGLEWDRILILPDYKHHLQHFEDEELKVIEEDDYRYLYVAITRTKKHLSIPKIYDTSFTHEDISDFIYLDDKEGEDVIQAEMRHYNMIRQAKLKLKLDLDIDGDN